MPERLSENTLGQTHPNWRQSARKPTIGTCFGADSGRAEKEVSAPFSCPASKYCVFGVSKSAFTE